MLIIIACDDPFFTQGTVGYLQRAAAGTCYVKVHATESGGHLGHFAAFPQWCTQVITDFFVYSTGLACAGNQPLAPSAQLK